MGWVMKKYSMDHRYIFGKEQPGLYVMLCQYDYETVPHMTNISSTDPIELQDIVNLLNLAPDMHEKAKAQTYEMMTGKRKVA